MLPHGNMGLLLYMQKSTEFTRQTSIHIIDERIKYAGFTAYWYDIVVCNHRWNKGAITFMECYFHARNPIMYSTISRNTHGYDETIVFNKITMHRSCQLHNANTEIGRVHNLNGLICNLLIIGNIVLLNMIIKSLCC